MFIDYSCPLYAHNNEHDHPGCCWWNQIDDKNIEYKQTNNLEKNKMENKSKDTNTDNNLDNPSIPIALNGRVILETYKEDRSLKAEVSNGFAMIQQKIRVTGLKALADGMIPNGTKYGQYINKGDLVYIKEKSLRDAPWAKDSFVSEAIDGQFMIVDSSHVEFIVKK